MALICTPGLFRLCRTGVPIPSVCCSLGGQWDAPHCSQHRDPIPGTAWGRGRVFPAGAGDGPGHAAWEPDGPWARLRRSLPPAPPGTVRRRGLRSAALAAGRSGDASMM